MMKLISDNSSVFDTFDVDNVNSLYYGLDKTLVKLIKDLRVELMSMRRFDHEHFITLSEMATGFDVELKQTSPDIHEKSIRLAQERFNFYPNLSEKTEYLGHSQCFVEREFDVQERMESSNSIEQYEFLLIELAQCARIDKRFTI